MSITFVTGLMAAGACLLGAFPGSAAGVVDTIADAIRNGLATAAARLRESMTRHDPATPEGEAQPSRSRLVIGSLSMSVAFVILAPAEGYLFFLGLTGLLGIVVAPEAIPDVTNNIDTTGFLGSVAQLLSRTGTSLLIEASVVAAITTTLIVAAVWSFDEQHLVRPRNERSRIRLGWRARAGSAAAIVTILCAGLHRATAGLESASASVAVSDVMRPQEGSREAATADSYLRNGAASPSTSAPTDRSALDTFRSWLALVGTLSSVLAPMLVLSIAFLSGPLALAGLLWSVVLLCVAGALITVAGVLSTFSETVRRIANLLINACASLLLPLVVASRTAYDRERNAQRLGVPFSTLKLALASWVSLVETEQLLRLREQQASVSQVGESATPTRDDGGARGREGAPQNSADAQPDDQEFHSATVSRDEEQSDSAFSAPVFNAYSGTIHNYSRLSGENDE